MLNRLTKSLGMGMEGADILQVEVKGRVGVVRGEGRRAAVATCRVEERNALRIRVVSVVSNQVVVKL